MAGIYILRRDGTYRNNCECGATSESLQPLDPETPYLDQQTVDFMNLHTGLGHSGVTEFWYQRDQRWIEGGRWSPTTDSDIEWMGKALS